MDISMDISMDIHMEMPIKSKVSKLDGSCVHEPNAAPPAPFGAGATTQCRRPMTEMLRAKAARPGSK